MAIYHGVVRGSVVALPEGVHLDDGLEVEIRTAEALPADADDQMREDLFKQRLRDAGLIQETAPSAPMESEDPVERRPVIVRGKPLSQVVIDERR